MARATLAEAKQELYELYVDGEVPLVEGVTKVYDHEPFGGDLAKPVSITMITAGMDPEFWRVALRIYVDTAMGAKKAQDTLDELMPAVEAMWTDGFGPSDWDVDYAAELKAMVAETVVQIGREDIDD